MVKLAVIGAGIGGCGAVYLARNTIPNADIKLYESNDRVGGRVYTYRKDGIVKDIGANFFHNSNKNIQNIVNKLNIEHNEIKDTLSLGIWNGSKFLFRSSQNKVVSVLKAIPRYGWDMLKILGLINETKKRVTILYRESERDPRELNDLLHAAGINEYYQQNFNELLQEKDVNQSFIDEVATPISRIIYAQDAEMGGFAGISSLLGPFNPPIYYIPKGNDIIPQNLVESSNPELFLEHKVNAIEGLSNEKYRVSGNNFSQIYDYVIIAAPLEQLEIRFEDVAIPEKKRDFQTVHITTVQGRIDPDYFGIEKSKDLPSFILTTKESDRFTHMSMHHVGSSQMIYYSISSIESLSDGLLDEMFHEWRIGLNHTWKAAYPLFKPISEVPPSRLGEGLFNLNAIESAASSMESSLFAANNSIRWINKARPK